MNEYKLYIKAPKIFYEKLNIFLSPCRPTIHHNHNGIQSAISTSTNENPILHIRDIGLMVFLKNRRSSKGFEQIIWFEMREPPLFCKILYKSFKY